MAQADIELDTHVKDIVNVLHYENLHDVILVGHSYGSAVVTCVANDVPERIQQLVCLDSQTFTHGQRFRDVASPAFITAAET